MEPCPNWGKLGHVDFTKWSEGWRPSFRQRKKASKGALIVKPSQSLKIRGKWKYIIILN
jgi:hypothetical protein